MARVLEGVELVRLGVLVERGLDLRGLLGRRVACLRAPKSPSKGHFRSGVRSIGRDRSLGREIFRRRDDAPAVAVDRGVEVETARNHVSLAPAGAVADHADAAVRRSGARGGSRPRRATSPMHCSSGTPPASRAAAAASVALRAGCVPMEQVGAQCGVAVDRERAHDLLRRTVVAGHVVDDDHARIRTGQRSAGRSTPRCRPRCGR